MSPHVEMVGEQQQRVGEVVAFGGGGEEKNSSNYRTHAGAELTGGWFTEPY